MRKTKPGFPWLPLAVHLVGWVPLAVLIFDFETGRLSVNPIQDIEQRLGRLALYFLVACLAVTPLYTLTGWRAILPRRRALGLYTFLYACLHVLAFVGLDYGFALMAVLGLILSEPYLIMGALAFLALIPLAATSFTRFQRKMGRNWKRLHWLIYPLGLVVIIHYGWSLKGNLFELRGNVLQPLLWGMVWILLLVLRLPPLRRFVSRTRLSMIGRLVRRRAAGGRT
jgi:sulfoxide reductase heme-binding subunit YedZ